MARPARQAGGLSYLWRWQHDWPPQDCPLQQPLGQDASASAGDNVSHNIATRLNTLIAIFFMMVLLS